MAERLSSVQRFVLKEILLNSFSGASDRRYVRTRESLFQKGLLTATWCGELTDAGRAIAKKELDAERARRSTASGVGAVQEYRCNVLFRDGSRLRGLTEAEVKQHEGHIARVWRVPVWPAPPGVEGTPK